MECGKHDCFIVSSEGEVLAGVFTIPNNMDGFHCLLQKIRECKLLRKETMALIYSFSHFPANIR